MERKELGPKVGRQIGGGLRSAPEGMSYVDITGRVDGDNDGIVFEGIPGMERPIIPRFLVPTNLAGKLSKLVEGDSLEIERQRRAGNTNIEFDESKFNSIISPIIQNLYNKKCKRFICIFFITHFDDKFALAIARVYHI